MSYVDTSIIVASLDPLDPRSRKARRILEEEKGKVVSELVLAELASVVARREELVSSIAGKLGLSAEEAVVAILLYIIRRFNLRYRSVEGHARLPLLGRIYKPIATAIELSRVLRLKALDLLHVAYAKTLKDSGEQIQKLLTADRDFEKAREYLRREIGIDLYII